MIIEESDFRMTLSGGYSWDLELAHLVKPKKGEPRLEFKVVGYGMSMESCMKRIINKRLEDKKETYSLKEFVDAFKEETDKLKQLLEGL